MCIRDSIESRTNAVDIALGQQATLDAVGVLGPASSGGPPEQITLINDYGPIHPSLSGASVGPDRVVRVTPIYVAPRSIVRGSASLRPLDKVQIWFQQDFRPGVMPVSYTHLRAHETPEHLVCRLL